MALDNPKHNFLNHAAMPPGAGMAPAQMRPDDILGMLLGIRQQYLADTKLTSGKEKEIITQIDTRVLQIVSSFHFTKADPNG